MLNLKSKSANSSINNDRFPLYFRNVTNIKKFYTLFSWQINSLKTYLWDVFDNYRFHPSSISFSEKNKNWPDYYPGANGASDSSLLRLAKGHNIDEVTYSRIMFEWNQKFLLRGTEAGIIAFVRLFFKYELVAKYFMEDVAEDIANEIHVNVQDWYDSVITEGDNVYSFNDMDILTLSLEIYIPKAYAQYFIDMQPKLARLMDLVYNVIVPTARVNYVEISWR